MWVLLGSLIEKAQNRCGTEQTFFTSIPYSLPLHRSQLIFAVHPEVLVNGRKQRADVSHQKPTLSETPEIIKIQHFPAKPLPNACLVSYHHLSSLDVLKQDIEVSELHAHKVF